MNPSSLPSKADPWLSHGVRIQQVTPETPGVATYDLVFEDHEIGSGFRFSPGQFNMLYVPGIGEAAISISSDPCTPHVLRHTIRAVGGVTSAIAAAGRGMQLGLRGPFGSNWPIDACLKSTTASAIKKDVIVVAGGIGLAPLRPLVYALVRQRDQVGRIVVMVGARSQNDLLFHDEYALWRKKGVEVQTTVDRATSDWHGNVGVVTGLLNRLVLSHPERTLLMTCGPEVMMRYVVLAALQRKFLPSRIWISLERHMNCAVGLCGHCQLGPEFLCKDGPVLPYPRVAEWLKVQSL